MITLVYRIQGGEPFSVSLPGMPTIHHDGVLTVGSLMVASELVRPLVDGMTMTGARVSVAPSGESQEVLEERVRRQAGEDPGYLTPACPRCSFLELIEGEPICGLDVLPIKVIEAVRHVPHRRRDLLNCPRLMGGD